MEEWGRMGREGGKGRKRKAAEEKGEEERDGWVRKGKGKETAEIVRF